MSDTASAPAVPEPAGAPARFTSLADIRDAHQALLERQAGGDTAPPEVIPPGEIAAFLDRVKATGAILDDAEGRRVAQRVMDYWSADLVAASRASPIAVAPVQLAPWAPPDDDPAASGAAFQRPEDARQYIRLTALARQWRESGARGYLLSGDALREAEKFERDPDVAALIRESREAQGDALRRGRRFRNGLIAGLVAVIVALSGLSWLAIAQRRETEQVAAGLRLALAERDAEARAVVSARESALAERDLARQSAERLRQAYGLATEQLRDQQSRQRTLDAALDLLVRQIREGRVLDFSEISSQSLRAALAARLAPRVRPDPLASYGLSATQPVRGTDDELAAPPSAEAVPDRLPPAPRPGAMIAALPEPPGAAADDAPPSSAGADDGAEGSATVPPPGASPSPAPVAAGDGTAPPASPAGAGIVVGYDPGFLGVGLPLPGLAAGQAATAWQGGAPIPYFNFSLVLDARRRLAILSAANLDRARSRSVPRGPDEFSADPRIPLEAQPDPGFFEGPGIERGHLVPPWDIAWGEALPRDTTEAAGLVAQFTDRYPNFVPQRASVNRGTWAAVEEWVRLRHNPGASQVTILSGPVFAEGEDDDVLPVAFWKIAVSVQPGLSRNPAGKPLVVDAFLVPNDGSAPLPADDYRVTVDQIAVRTGLKFPAALAEATRPGERLAAQVADLGAPEAARRKRLVQDLVNLLRSPTAAGADQRTVTEALLRMANGASVEALSPAGRVNLFFVLSQIPASTWDREAWLPLKAQARRAVAGLGAGMGQEARRNLDALRQRIGLSDPFGQTVHVQFAGLTRERAAAISEGLRTLGWRVPDEERVEPALNEVRYNPGAAADAQAAQLLAADLHAAGQEGVTARPFDIVKPGVLEAWISR